MYSEHRTIGVFWHNAAETWVDVGHSTTDKVGNIECLVKVQKN